MVDAASVPRFTETDEYPDTIPMLQNGWPPTGGPVNVLSDQGLLNWPLQLLTNRTHNLDNRLNEMALTAGSLVTIGPGGDYGTINLALADLSGRRPAYAPGGFTTTLRLLSGFVMAEQVLLSAVNLGWLTISSEDAEVFIDRAYLNTEFGSGYPAFGASGGGVIPQIDAQFVMMATGPAEGRFGIHAFNGAGGRVISGGVRNCGSHGIMLQTSGTLDANNSDFSNAGGCGLYALGGTRASVQSAVLSGAGQDGIASSSAATVHATTADCSGAAGRGIFATRGGTVNARGALARIGAADSTSDFVVSEGGTITANGGTGGTSISPNTVTGSGIIFK
jgi:hypothetical protein